MCTPWVLDECVCKDIEAPPIFAFVLLWYFKEKGHVRSQAWWNGVPVIRCLMTKPEMVDIKAGANRSAHKMEIFLSYIRNATKFPECYVEKRNEAMLVHISRIAGLFWASAAWVKVEKCYLLWRLRTTQVRSTGFPCLQSSLSIFFVWAFLKGCRNAQWAISKQNRSILFA